MATAGLYTLVVAGVTYSYTATGGDSIEDIRDGLFADTINFVAHPAHPSWTGNKVSTDAITVTGNNPGETLVVTSNLGPGGIEATVVETTPIVPETITVIAAGIEAAITGAAVPPPNYTPVAAVGVVTITANAGFEGTDLGIISNGPAAGDLVQVIATDHRELVLTVRDALVAALAGPSHPTFTDSTVGSDTITITGTVQGAAVPLSVSAVNDNILLVEVTSVLTLRTAQVTRITIATNPADTFAFPGTYELTAFGTMVSYVAAASETPTSVRDAVQALVDANIPEVTTSLAGVQAFDMTSNTFGRAVRGHAEQPELGCCDDPGVDDRLAGHSQRYPAGDRRQQRLVYSAELRFTGRHRGRNRHDGRHRSGLASNAFLAGQRCRDEGHPDRRGDRRRGHHVRYGHAAEQGRLEP